MTLRILLVVFALTAIANTVAQLIPLAGERLQFVALLLDLVPFGAVVAATAITAIRLKRESLSLRRLLVALYGYFAGALVGALGVAHLVAVVLASVVEGRHTEFVYSFRFYSLLQLGVLLIAAGLIAAIQAARLAGGERAAWRASLWVWTVILAINLALVPLQRFALLFSVLAAVGLFLLTGMRRHFSGNAAVEHVPDTSRS